MKRILLQFLLFICCFLVVFSFKKGNTKKTKPTFLIGSWCRVNDKPNRKTFEIWDANFKGFGYTLKEKDTVFKEHMEIVLKRNVLFLKVEGVNEVPTFFKFTSQTYTSFVCENPKNEFPKKIKYYLENDFLKAEVSNPDYKIDFVFKKH